MANLSRFFRGDNVFSSAFRQKLNAIVDWINGQEDVEYARVPAEESAGTGPYYRVTASSVLIADRKWTYELTPQRKKAAPPLYTGTGSFYENDPDGTVLTNCRNINEDQNTSGSTLQGNDIDFSLAPFGTTPGTLARKLQPIKGNRPVKIVDTSVDSSGTPVLVYWFDAPNIVQEDCIA